MQEQHTNHVSNKKSKLGWVHECVYQQDAFDLETLSFFLANVSSTNCWCSQIGEILCLKALKFWEVKV